MFLFTKNNKKIPTISIENKVVLNNWLVQILAHPVTKNKIDIKEIIKHKNILDLRYFNRDNQNFDVWKSGQNAFEKWINLDREYFLFKKNKYIAEIINVKKVYDHFNIKGKILDVGAHIGTLRVLKIIMFQLIHLLIVLKK